ncbi:MAG: spore cortex biosynthesis protein YabQ [Bacillota bacterium]
MKLIISQIYVFIIMLLFGLGLNGIYLLYYRSIREIFNDNLLLCGLFDILLGIMAGVLGFILLFNINYGEVRIFTFIAIALGACLGHLLFKGILSRL